MPAHTSPPPKPSLAVVGAGVGGLALAHKLLRDTRRWPNAHVTLYERKPRFGGRVKTVRTDDGWYEAGASRVGDTHTRVRQFAKSVGCTEVALPTSYDQRHTLPPLHARFKAIHKRFVKAHGEAALESLTWHDVLTLECASLAERDDLERRWGFLSVLTEMNAADFWAHAMPQYLCKTYVTFEGGLQTMVDNAVEALRTPPLQARTTIEGSVRVLRVDPVTRNGRRRVQLTVEPDVDYMALPTPGAPVHHHVHKRTKTYDAVFLALPAEALAELEGDPARYPHLWSSVSRNRLLRCYARFGGGKEGRAKSTPPKPSVITCCYVAQPGQTYRVDLKPSQYKRLNNGWQLPKGHSSAGFAGRVGRWDKETATDILSLAPEHPARKKWAKDVHTFSTSKRNGTRRRASTASPRRPSRRARSDADLCKATVATTALCRCTSTHSAQWKQIAYCDHRHADHLYNVLRMPKGLDVLRGLTRDALGPAWAGFGDGDTDVYYWKRGTHSWKPKLTAADHYARALQPDAKAPWFVVGASLSHYQHWMEGALETANDAYAKFCRYTQEWWGVHGRRRVRSSASATDRPTRVYLHKACAHSTKRWTMADVKRERWVVLDGYVYDVSDMVDRHPGGAALLERMRGRDISDVYHRIGHSSTARAWVEEGCVGVLATDAQQSK